MGGVWGRDYRLETTDGSLVPTARAPREKVGSVGIKSRNEEIRKTRNGKNVHRISLSKLLTMVSLLQFTITINLLQFVLKGYVYIPYQVHMQGHCIMVGKQVVRSYLAGWLFVEQ